MTADFSVETRLQGGPLAAETMRTTFTARVAADRLLYLDFDGVLHPEDVYRHPRRGVYLGASTGAGHFLFEHAPMLAELLRPHPDVRVVLSTSWVRVLGYSQAVKKLPVAIGQRVVGATWHSRMDESLFLQLSRGQQVISDVSRRRPRSWVALDDDADDWPEQHLMTLIRTDPIAGLGAKSVQINVNAWLDATMEP